MRYNILAVTPPVPAKSVAELIALVKSQPGKLNYAASSPGSMSHLSMELFKQMAGIDVVQVPFKGDAESMTALLGNHVQLTFLSVVTLLPQIKAGKLRPLAVATATRESALPDVPTVAESGLPGYEITLWYGVVAAAGTPANIVNKLNDLIRQVQDKPETKARVVASGSTVFYSTPAEFGAIIKRDADKLGRLIRDVGIKVE
jgi:tripartite-type tricarboxylate transporter receptor subunit TctC